MISESIWSAMESSAPTSSGWAKTRVLQHTPHDLWIGVKHPQLYRSLIYVVPAQHAPLSKHIPQLRYIAVDLVPHDEDHLEIHIRLEDTSLAEVFTVLVSDIAQRIGKAESVEGGVETLLSRLRHWRNLLQPDAGHGLSREKRRGLFGELYLMRRLIEAGIPSDVVVGAWVGPSGAHQDFQAAAVSVEVKSTSSKKPQSLRISSERQLDSTGIDRLVLAHVSLDERKAGAGESLPTIVADLEVRLEADTLRAFRQMLYLAGLLPSAMEYYQEPVYALRALEYFEVDGEFPRIVESKCPDGVGDVHYSIQLGSIYPYSFAEDSLLDLLGGARCVR